MRVLQRAMDLDGLGNHGNHGTTQRCHEVNEHVNAKEPLELIGP